MDVGPNNLMDRIGLQFRADLQISSSMFSCNTTKALSVLTLIQVNPAPNKSHCSDGQTVKQETGAKGDLLNATGGRRTNSQSYSLGFGVPAITRVTISVAWKRLAS